MSEVELVTDVTNISQPSKPPTLVQDSPGLPAGEVIVRISFETGAAE